MGGAAHPDGTPNAKSFGPALRLRFAGYVTCLLFALIICALMLLVATGSLNPAQRSVEQTLDHQLEYSIDFMTRNIDEAAANGLALSKHLSHSLNIFLSQNDLTFEDLRDNQEYLMAFQLETYDQVVMSARATPCSGAFFVLNTTVNSALEVPTSSGLYLKYVNINAESTTTNALCLYRGFHSVAREKGVNLHSSWQLETESGTFPAWEKTAALSGGDLASSYFFTETYDLPGSWEKVRFVCLPVFDAEGHAVGACGFEVSDLCFQLTYRTLSDSYGYSTCILLDENEATTRGCLAGSQSGFLPASSDLFTVSPSGDLVVVENGGASYVGKMSLLPEGNGTHAVVAALPESLYESMVNEGRTKVIISLLVTLVIALALSWYLGKRYLKPVDKHLIHLHSQVEAERARTQSKLDMLADKKKLEVDPLDYQAFREGLRTLTPKERTILNLLAQGYSADDVMEAAGISRNTLKYHNRNIYAKLGVSSRKQLMLYLQLLKQEPDAEDSPLI